MADELRSKLAFLYRRAGFSARSDELDAATTAGYESTVEALLDRSSPDPGADAVAVPDLRTTAFDPSAETLEERRERLALRRQQREALIRWWLDRMVAAHRPGREKLAWFWHGHFATSLEKVDIAQLMYTQNQTLRTYGAGSFEPLVQAVAKDAAMMVWLDSNSNRKGSPNENFARELMELFTIGIGNYTDGDVREAARAFTGWRVDRLTGVFRVQQSLVDTAPKTLLGQTVQTGEQVISVLCRHPAAARFVSAAFWSRHAYPVKPDDPLVVNELAPGFAADGNITNLARRVFLHPQFLSGTARQGLVKQPVEYLAGALRQLRMTPEHLDLAGVTAVRGVSTLGQVPFEPPSVGGWPQNGYWVNTATTLARLRLAQAIANNAPIDWLSAVPAAQRPTTLARELGIVDGWTPATAAALATTTNARQQLTVALVSPEYVLN